MSALNVQISYLSFYRIMKIISWKHLDLLKTFGLGIFYSEHNFTIDPYLIHILANKERNILFHKISKFDSVYLSIHKCLGYFDTGPLIFLQYSWQILIAA